MSLADLALNAHKTYTDAIDREDDAREIWQHHQSDWNKLHRFRFAQ